MSRDIVILGTGGCAREIQWLLEDNNSARPDAYEWNILGFVEPHPEPGRIVNDLPVYSDDWLFGQQGICVAAAIGEATRRKRVVEKAKRRNPSLIFPPLVSRLAMVSSRVEIGEGCIICAGAIVTCNIILHDFAIINLGSVITHDIEIGAFSQINPSTNLSGKVKVGDCVQIGTGAKVIPEVKIGNHAVIGAGAVVIRDVPEGCTVAGCPARVIKNTAREG